MDNTQAAAILLQQVQNLRSIRAQWRKRTGAEFNIFSILQMERDERNTHCRLIYELLQPDGCHGMGDAFLREFFSVLGLDFPEDEPVRIEREYPFRNGQYAGQIDILIEGGGFCYPIEVKIDADDQYLQVKRYADFAAGRAKSSRVYYLTLDGHDPSENSTGGCDSLDVTCLSFAKDIRNWLERCAELTWSAPVISGTIQQYIDLLDKLTGSKKESGFEKMMQEMIGGSRASFESAVEIADTLPAVKTQMLLRVFRDIESHMNVRLKWDYSDYEEVGGQYYTKRGEQIPCLIYPIAVQGDLTLALAIAVEWNLFMGISLWNENGDFEEKATDELPTAFAQEGWGAWIRSFRHKSGESWWKLLPEQTPLNFKECTGIYPELYDAERYGVILQRICAEIDECLASLENMGVLARRKEVAALEPSEGYH